MGELMFKPKDGGEWRPLTVSKLQDIDFFSDMNEPQYRPMDFTLTGKIKPTKQMWLLIKRLNRWQKLHERRVLRKWQEKWHKRHTLWAKK